MHSARSLLVGLALITSLTLAATAWAQSDSGGAKPTPVVPGGGGGGVVTGEDSGSGGQPGVDPLPETTPVVPPPVESGPDAPVTSQDDEEPYEEIILGLEDEDKQAREPAETGGGAPAENTDSGGGAFGFLASTGFEVAALVTAGAGLVLAGMAIRANRRVKTPS